MRSCLVRSQCAQGLGASSRLPRRVLPRQARCEVRSPAHWHLRLRLHLRQSRLCTLALPAHVARSPFELPRSRRPRAGQVPGREIRASVTGGSSLSPAPSPPGAGPRLPRPPGPGPRRCPSDAATATPGRRGPQAATLSSEALCRDRRRSLASCMGLYRGCRRSNGRAMWRLQLNCGHPPALGLVDHCQWQRPQVPVLQESRSLKRRTAPAPPCLLLGPAAAVFPSRTPCQSPSSPSRRRRQPRPQPAASLGSVPPQAWVQPPRAHQATGAVRG